MDFTLPSIATYLGSWFALIGGIWTLFDRAETVASEEAKSKVAAWLNSDVTPSSSKWSSFVLQGFNNIFGAKQLSLHCFLYSSLASVIFVISFLLLFLAIRPEQGQELFESGPIVLFWLLLISAAFNLIPDYISLLQTRLVLNKINDSKSKSAVIFWFLLDFVITALIVVVTFFTVFWFIGLDDFDDLVVLFIYGATLKAGGEGVESEIPMGIFYYSTFLTSIWIWLFLLSSVIAKTSIRANKLWIKSKSFFDIDTKPIKSIGFVSILVVTTIYLIAPILWLFI